jgi:NAD(P)-dependent dehydrogenase (short-subunit alcohol dehydrogenase family)
MKGVTALMISSLNGLALNIVHKFAKQGYNIVVNGDQNDANIIRTIQNEYQRNQIIVLTANLQKEIDVYNFVEQILNQFQYIDILIINNQCRRHHRAAIDEFLSEKWREIIDYNLISTFTLIFFNIGHTQINTFEQFDQIKTLGDLILYLCRDQARSISGQSIPWSSI